MPGRAVFASHDRPERVLQVTPDHPQINASWMGTKRGIVYSRGRAIEQKPLGSEKGPLPEVEHSSRLQAAMKIPNHSPATLGFARPTSCDHKKATIRAQAISKCRIQSLLTVVCVLISLILASNIAVRALNVPVSHAMQANRFARVCRQTFRCHVSRLN